MNIQNVRIDSITVGQRHRKALALDSLVESIRTTTLLHPIGVTPQSGLVYGYRRLRACQELGWEEIPARFIDLPSMINGEYDENRERKPYTPSEMVAIVESLRGYTHGGDRRSNQVRNCDVDPLTIDEAVKLLGWTKDHYYRAKVVIDKGVPELVEAMDTGTLSVSAAATMAEASSEDQRELLTSRPNEQRWTATAVKKQLRRKQRKQRWQELLDGAASLPQSGDQIRIYHSSFQSIEKTAGIAPNSVDLICTDIPYVTEFLPEIDELGAFAARVLKPGGLFVSYFGQHRLLEKLVPLGNHLKYQWLAMSTWQGVGTFVARQDVVSKCIPIAIYSKGDWKPLTRWVDTIGSEGEQKKWHPWQRPLPEVERLIQYFSKPGELVVDPCGGGFTTAIACLHMNRRCIACDIDEQAVIRGQQRLAEELGKQPTCVSLREPLEINTVTCGDCREELARLPDKSANLVLTSPPYAEQRKDQYPSVPEKEYPEFTCQWMEKVRDKLTDDGSVLIVIDPHVEEGEMADYVLRTELALRQAGWKQHQTQIWHKFDKQLAGHKWWPTHQYEQILWFSKTSKPFCDPAMDVASRQGISVHEYPQQSKGSGRKRAGRTRTMDVIRVPVGSNAKGINHPAPFPVALAERLIHTFCVPGGTVLDPFAGSGSTLVAAKRLGRNYYGFDLVRKYCKIARDRLAQVEPAVLMVAG